MDPLTRSAANRTHLADVLATSLEMTREYHADLTYWSQDRRRMTERERLHYDGKRVLAALLIADLNDVRQHRAELTTVQRRRVAALLDDALRLLSDRPAPTRSN